MKRVKFIKIMKNLLKRVKVRLWNAIFVKIIENQLKNQNIIKRWPLGIKYPNRIQFILYIIKIMNKFGGQNETRWILAQIYRFEHKISFFNIYCIKYWKSRFPIVFWLERSIGAFFGIIDPNGVIFNPIWPKPRFWPLKPIKTPPIALYRGYPPYRGVYPPPIGLFGPIRGGVPPPYRGGYPLYRAIGGPHNGGPI